MSMAINEAAQLLVALDREAMARGEEISLAETLNRLPRLGYEMSRTDLVDKI
jgi:hypothetical protein